MLQCVRLVGLALLLSVGFGTAAKAASFECSEAATETEIAICGDQERCEKLQLRGTNTIR